MEYFLVDSIFLAILRSANKPSTSASLRGRPDGRPTLLLAKLPHEFPSSNRTLLHPGIRETRHALRTGYLLYINRANSRERFSSVSSFIRRIPAIHPTGGLRPFKSAPGGFVRSSSLSRVPSGLTTKLRPDGRPKSILFDCRKTCISDLYSYHPDTARAAPSPLRGGLRPFKIVPDAFVRSSS